MKIKIEFTIEVDPEKWASEYGVEKSDVRKDVANHFKVQCQEWLENSDLK
jgi:hypothetical protein